MVTELTPKHLAAINRGRKDKGLKPIRIKKKETKKKTTTKKSKYLPIVEAKIKARKIAKKLNIKNEKDWFAAYDAGKIPQDLPRSLKSVYGKTSHIK